MQKHIRYIGKDSDNPNNFPINVMHFGYIATRLMQGDLSPTELFDMIEKTGNHVNRENLERIGLFYNFKKTPFPFHYTGKDHLGIRKMQKRTE